MDYFSAEGKSYLASADRYSVKLTSFAGAVSPAREFPTSFPQMEARPLMEVSSRISVRNGKSITYYPLQATPSVKAVLIFP